MDYKTILIVGIGLFLLWKTGIITTVFSALGNVKEKLTPAPRIVESDLEQYVAPLRPAPIDSSVTGMVRRWEEFKNAADAGGAKEASKAMDDVFALIIKKE